MTENTGFKDSAEENAAFAEVADELYGNTTKEERRASYVARMSKRKDEFADLE